MQHKDKILELRSKGHTYNYISSQLNCSKGTVSYHCGNNQKDKNKNRQINYISKDRLYFIIKRKIYNFSNKVSNRYTLYNTRSTNLTQLKSRIRYKCKTFNKAGNKAMTKIKARDIYSIIQENPKCSLSGRTIDFYNTSSWQLDHIIPSSKNGSNDLENCQIVCKEANQAKSDLTTEEFIELCKDVLKYNGYTVEPTKS